MRLFFLLLILIPSIGLSNTFKIESHPVLSSIIREMNNPGSTPEIYPVSENYRLDLTLIDLIDQTTLLLEEHQEHNDRLSKILYRKSSVPDFLSWFRELKVIAGEDENLKRKFDKNLYMQFYAPSGVALIPDYKLIDFRKIKDNRKLQRIKRYNKYASDPEGQGLLLAFSKKEWKGFYTKPLTVAKLKKTKLREIQEIHDHYYDQLFKLYSKHDPEASFRKTRSGIQVKEEKNHSIDSAKIFNVIQELPSKHQILFLLSQKIKGLFADSGFIILTPAFIEQNFEVINNALQEITLDQILHSDDDQYILSIRNFIQKNIERIEVDLKAFNEKNSTEHKLVWTNRSNKPGRLEALANIDTLLLLYPESPWFKDQHGSIIDRNGRQIYLGESGKQKITRILKGLGKEIIESENCLSFLAGGIVFAVSDGNVPVAMATRNLVKKAIKTKKYDREWEHFLKDVPGEVLNAMLVGSGAAPGRFYKIMALGAGQGVIQSLLTGQDVKTGALVGAGLNIVQYYILPTSWARPMTSGYDPKALAMNRRLELLEGSIKGFIQGASVAVIEGDDITQGALKGAAFGFVSTQMVIWFLGTRYNPFKGWTDSEVDEMIRLENEFQNVVGRGGEYAIDRQLILDANFRVGGLIPAQLGVAITLPGNVTMNGKGYNSLAILTHEASHLMQQHQSGVFGFYLFRYIPTYLRTGYLGHPDENFLFGVYGS